MKVIIINGSNRVGKDKFVKYFDKNTKGKIFEISTVDHIKAAAIQYFDWDGKKTDEARQFLVDIKQACIKFNNGPFNYVINEIEENGGEYNFIHVREPEEIQKFKDYYEDDLITVLIRRDDRYVADNEADSNVENYEYDYYIDNNGVEEDLEQEVIKFIKTI